MQILFGPSTKKDDTEAIEKNQKRGTKLVISLRKLPYTERLQHLNLYILKYRRLRGDMIEVFKILHHMYNSSVAPELIRNTSATRGNKYKLLNHTFHYDFRKFSFAARIVNVWTSLPDYVVNVISVALFNKNLAIANRSRVSCAHNTLRASIGIHIPP